MLSAEFVAISSDTPRRGWFECSDTALSRFHENVVWSQRDNFVSVPTDCPQRDERLGWTGDAQAFGPTACTLFDAQAFWSSWLIDLALDQDAEARRLPTVVPDVVLDGESRFGRAGWADAATMVPWAVYESFGDIEVLRRQYDSMKRHVESLCDAPGHRTACSPSRCSSGTGSIRTRRPNDRGSPRPTRASWPTPSSLTARRLLARAATLLGRTDDASHYRAVAEQVAARTWAEWGEHAATTQTGSAVALCFDLVPEGERAALAATLARLVREADGRVATGFLGTPLVLPALASAGHWDEAYRMLLRTEVPSWLYQVGQGATTVWERWDAIRPDGSIHPGTMESVPEIEGSDGNESHMLSFNHYAYGAVIDWVYRHVAGLAPDVDVPGYRHVLLAPKPAHGIEWASASVETPYGTVSSSWRIVEDSLIAEVDLPFGASGTFTAPTTPGSSVTIDGATAGAMAALAPGRHRITVGAPMIAGTARSGRSLPEPDARPHATAAPL